MFLMALSLHVIAGLAAVVAAVIAATARKRPGRHPGAGRVYLCATAVVVTTALAMSAMRWQQNRHLAAIAVISAGLAMYGRRARVRRGPGWVRRHAIGMGGSFIALLTGFYVDNGHRLPVWNLLPHYAYWTLPSAVGTVLIWWALRRYRAGISTRPRSAWTAAAKR